MVIIAILGGTEASLDLGAVLSKRLHIVGSLLRSRALTEKIGIKSEFENRHWALLETGRVKPVIDRVMSIKDVVTVTLFLKLNVD